MTNLTKQIFLFVFLLSVVSTAFGRSIHESIDMNGSYFEWGKDLYLDRMIEENNYQIRVNDLKIESVMVYLRGHGDNDKVRIIVGDFNQYFDVYKDNYSYQRIEVSIPTYYRQNSKEWKLRIEGFVTIDRIDVVLYDRNGPNNNDVNWNNNGNGNNHGPNYSSEFVQLNRFINVKLADHNITTSRYVDQGYKFELQLGKIFSYPEPQTQELYECLVNGRDHMLSTNSVCEGTEFLGIAGYILTVQKPGTKALYRCLAESRDHFASLDSNCEGRTKEGILGYIY
jgi:hypothetical protein